MASKPKAVVGRKPVPMPPARPAAPEFPTWYAKYDYEAQNADELSITTGDALYLVKKDSGDSDWSLCRNVKTGAEGVVPFIYLSEEPENPPAAEPAAEPPAEPAPAPVEEPAPEEPAPEPEAPAAPEAPAEPAEEAPAPAPLGTPMLIQPAMSPKVNKPASHPPPAPAENVVNPAVRMLPIPGKVALKPTKPMPKPAPEPAPEEQPAEPEAPASPPPAPVSAKPARSASPPSHPVAAPIPAPTSAHEEKAWSARSEEKSELPILPFPAGTLLVVGPTGRPIPLTIQQDGTVRMPAAEVASIAAAAPAPVAAPATAQPAREASPPPKPAPAPAAQPKPKPALPPAPTKPTMPARTPKTITPGPTPSAPDHFYSLDELTNAGGIPADVVPTEKEKYLSDDDFQTVFGMPKEEFYHLMKWKQDQLKKAKKLF